MNANELSSTPLWLLDRDCIHSDLPELMDVLGCTEEGTQCLAMGLFRPYSISNVSYYLSYFCKKNI